MQKRHDDNMCMDSSDYLNAACAQTTAVVCRDNIITVAQNLIKAEFK